MAQITWREVSAPDFSSAANGFAQFSRILGDALGSARATVTGFDQAKSDLVNQQLALALAQTPDAATARQAVQAGRIGSLDLTNPNTLRRLNPENLKAISPAALVQRELDQVKLGSDKTALASSQLNLDAAKTAAEQRAVRDGQSDLFARANALDRAGKTAEAEALRAQANYNGFGYDAVGALNTAAQTTQQNQIGNTRSLFELTTAQDSQRLSREGAKLAESIRQSGTPDTYEYQLNSLENVDPLVMAATRRELGLEGRAASGIAAAAGAGGAGGSAVTPGGPVTVREGSPFSTVFGNGKFGSADVANMSMGDVVAFGENVLIPRTRAAGYGKTADGKVIGTSASGAFQITKSTMENYGPKLFGANWRSVQFSPENQEKMARQIFEDSKKGNLKAVWEGLPDSRPGAYANMSWEQVKPLILRYELGANPAALALNEAVTNQDIKDTVQRVNVNTIAADFNQTFSDTRSVNEVALQLLNEEGFKGKGVDTGTIIGKLGEIQARAQKAGYPVNAATAAAILRHSQKEENFLERITFGEDLGNGRKVNWKAVDGYIGQLKDGTIKRAATINETLARGEQQYAIAKQQYDVAQAKLQQATLAAQNNPKYDQRLLQRAQANFLMAQAALQDAQEARSGQLPDDTKQNNPIEVARRTAASSPTTAPPAGKKIRFLPNEQERKQAAAFLQQFLNTGGGY